MPHWQWEKACACRQAQLWNKSKLEWQRACLYLSFRGSFLQAEEWVSLTLKVMVGTHKIFFDLHTLWDVPGGLKGLCISNVRTPPPTKWTKTDVLSRKLRWLELCLLSAWAYKHTVSTAEMSMACTTVKLVILPVQTWSNTEVVPMYPVFLLLNILGFLPSAKKCLMVRANVSHGFFDLKVTPALIYFEAS